MLTLESPGNGMYTPNEENVFEVLYPQFSQAFKKAMCLDYEKKNNYGFQTR